MNDRLFVLLLVLTLLDLAFVQATDVVPALELLPLWVLSAASFWLRRLQRHRSYRFAWNGGIVLVFALLVHHATTTGLLHMLEDGLVLAVLCQVHLLNNIGERQRPDLVFFNSFLIAFVTAFFAPDLTWSVLFVAHAFALVPALQMNAASRGGASPTPALLRRVRRDWAGRSLAIVALTAVAFVLVPRDFRRDGWLGDALMLQRQFEPALAETIRIGDERRLTLTDTVIARVLPTTGVPEDVPPHWRASAYSTFDGSNWQPQDARLLGARFATDPVWERHPDGSLRRSSPTGIAQRLQVQMVDPDAGRLLVPLTANRILPALGDRLPLEPRPDGAVRLLAADAGDARIDCTIECAPASGVAVIAPLTRTAMTALPAGLPPAVQQLVAQLRELVPPGGGTLAIAETCCSWLQQNRRYELPGQPGFADNLSAFLLGSGAGHCEYFATALVLVLRAQRVPCRLVGGYLAHEWDEAARAMVLRSKHAHAWVEVLADDGSWQTFDATPAADVRDRAMPDAGWLAALRATLERWWAAVTGFDQTSRDAWVAALASLPVEHPLALLGALAAIAGVVYLRRRRRQSLPSIATLHRALRAAGLTLGPGETPRELLTRAAVADLEPRVLDRLRAAASAHEASRYRPAPVPDPR